MTVECFGTAAGYHCTLSWTEMEMVWCLNRCWNADTRLTLEMENKTKLRLGTRALICISMGLYPFDNKIASALYLTILLLDDF